MGEKNRIIKKIPQQELKNTRKSARILKIVTRTQSF